MDTWENHWKAKCGNLVVTCHVSWDNDLLPTTDSRAIETEMSTEATLSYNASPQLFFNFHSVEHYLPSSEAYHTFLTKTQALGFYHYSSCHPPQLSQFQIAVQGWMLHICNNNITCWQSPSMSFLFISCLIVLTILIIAWLLEFQTETHPDRILPSLKSLP